MHHIDKQTHKRERVLVYHRLVLYPQIAVKRNMDMISGIHETPLVSGIEVVVTVCRQLHGLANTET